MRNHRKMIERETFLYFFLFLSLGILVAYLNRGHLEQQTNYVAQYVHMARYYKGEVYRAVLTYPTWGYPLVLLLFPTYKLVVIPQVVLGTLAMTALFVRMRRQLASHRTSLLILYVAAVPWFALHSVKWPLSFAASLIVCSLLWLEDAVLRNSLISAVLAGLCTGLALYFRSEFLYLPIFLAFSMAAAVMTGRIRIISFRPITLFAVMSWLVLAPWAIHYHRQTGRYSLTSSQRGIVAFISLGQLPGNPWGAVYRDEYARDYLRQRNINVPVQSDSADRVLFREFEHRINEHPFAFLRKVAWNSAVTLVSGFYDPEVPLSSSERSHFAELREYVKELRPYPASSHGGLPAAARADPKAVLALVYWISAKALGALFVIISLVGLLLMLFLRRTWSPLLLLLAGFLLYQSVLLMALTTEPRYLNGLYLPLVPFFLFAWTFAVGRQSRAAGAPAS
jgi:hypothetical protein